MSLGNRKVHWFLVAAVAALSMLAMTGCQQAAPPPPDTRAADEADIRVAEAGMAKAASPMDPARMVSFYTDDVLGLAADSSPVQGKENMLKYFQAMAKEGNPRITWTVAKVEVARSGDLAYSWGTGETIVTDKKGKDLKFALKYVSLWKKQADGSWKIAVDSIIPEPPAKK